MCEYRVKYLKNMKFHHQGGPEGLTYKCEIYEHKFKSKIGAKLIIKQNVMAALFIVNFVKQVLQVILH